MSQFLLPSKVKSDLIEIVKYTQLTRSQTQINDYLKILDNTFKLLAHEPELRINSDYIKEGYNNSPRGSSFLT